jgi:uncharacterized protein (TIGR03000 family)
LFFCSGCNDCLLCNEVAFLRTRIDYQIIQIYYLSQSRQIRPEAAAQVVSSRLWEEKTMYSMVLMAALTAGNATPYCHGCCGCWGGGWGCCGCWGGWGYGCWGCFGGCYGCFGGCYGCYGCWGGYASWGGYYGAPTYPGTVAPAAPGGPAPAGEGLPYPPEDTSKGKKKETRAPTNKAKLVVELPENAKLFIDDKPMKAASGVRSFNTPELEPGQAYYYLVRVETVRDGKPISETRRVIVRAGQVARANFKDMESDVVRTAQAK